MSSFMAYHDVPVEFDREFGFRYRPSQTFVGIRIVNKKPVLFYRRTIDEFGNPRCRKVPENAEITIAVFGDSFTAQADDDTLWTEVLENELSRRLSKQIRVVNYGRDAYGILQMFDLAAARVAQAPPDLVVFGFISDDLNRDRSWTHCRDGDNAQQAYSSDSPDHDEDSPTELGMPNGVFDKRVTEQWARAIVRTQKMDDELLISLNARHQELLESNLLPIDYWSFSRSFLFHRLRNRDPLFGLPGVTANPRFTATEFSDDARFVTASEKLQGLDCNVVLIHLPQYEELQAKQYILTPQQGQLLESLTATMQVRPLELIDHQPTDDLRSLFLLPHDRHPSAAGHRYYGQAIAAVLMEQEAF